MKIESVDKKQGKERNDLKMRIEEPKELYIYTKDVDDLIIDSQEVMDHLLEKMKNTVYDEKLADFYSTLSNEFEDLT